MAVISGGDRLERYLADLSRKVKSASQLKVGFLEGASYPDGTSVAMVAAINNFGAPSKGIPPRPFFTKMVKEKSGNWGVQLAELLKRNDYDAHKALALMGEGIKAQLRQAIVDMNEPALSQVTLLLRERFPNHDDIKFGDVLQAWADVARGVKATISGTGAKPLIWTGMLLASIDSEVT
jgi:hypothetical protein